MRKIAAGLTISRRASRPHVRSLFTLTAQRRKQAETKDDETKHAAAQAEEPRSTVKLKKSTQQLDEELQAAMEGRSGDGGLAGAELEGGKAVSMKRGVRENMFRYI